MKPDYSNRVLHIVEDFYGHSKIDVFNGKVVASISFVDTNYVSIVFEDKTSCVVKFEYNVYPEEEAHQIIAHGGALSMDVKHDLGLVTDEEYKEHEEKVSAAYYKSRMKGGATQVAEYIKYHGEDWLLEQLSKYKDKK